MAIKLPIIRYADTGRYEELRPADTLPGSSSTINTFETVSKNLSAVNAIVSYNPDETVASIVYTGGVLKTFNYLNGLLVSVILSGNTPGEITLTKTLGYTVNKLTTINYS